MNRNIDKNRIKRISLTAIFSAIAAVIMLFDFPLPFAPSFMKFDFSDVPLIIGSYILGPINAVIMVFLKVLIKLMFKGTSTVFIGELASFISSLCFVLPGSIIYVFNKTKVRAVIGLLIGIILSSIISTILNSVMLFPMYMNLFGISESVLLSMIQKVNPSVNSYTTAMIYSVLPFNLFKYSVDSIITFGLYKNISNFVKRF